MPDVTEQITAVPAGMEQVEAETTAPSQVEKTPLTPEAPETPTERTVPYGALHAERTKRKELERQLAEAQGRQQYQQYDPNDMENLLAHPFVQDLLIKDAKRELADYARDTLDKQFPNFPKAVRTAILKNARGFVNESTQDLETAKLDLLDYIEAIAQEVSEVPPQSKATFPVAATNTGASKPGVRPAQVEAIVHKPVDEWTEEEVAIVNEYAKKSK